MRGLGVGEQLQISLDQAATPSTSRPPSTIPPSIERPASRPAPPFFTHTVYHDHSDSGVDVSHSGSSLPSENNFISSLTNSTDCTPLHSLPGAGAAGGGGGGGPEGRMHSKSHHLLRSNRRSYSYNVGYGPQQASVNSLSAAYHRPTYTFGSTMK